MSPRTCRDVRADLSAYLEGDLDAGVTGETRVHLESCAACRSELDLLRLTVGALRGLPDLPPPAAILAGVRARLRPEPWYRRIPAGRQWLLGVPAGALATLLVVVGVSLFQARYPDVTKTVTQSPIPQSPAPPAPEVKRSRREQPSDAVKESRTASIRQADNGVELGRAKLAGERTRATVSAEFMVVGLPSSDGDTVDDIARLLRREGARDIRESTLEARAVREAFGPHRERVGPLLEPSLGWTVTASVPPRALARLLDALASRDSLRILEQPAAPTELEDPTVPREVRITVLR